MNTFLKRFGLSSKQRNRKWESHHYCARCGAETDSQGGCACVQTVGGLGNSVLAAQFYCDPKTALKNKVYLKLKIKNNTIFIY